MSSTRHASGLKPMAQEKYMSSPEFAELRGISGNAVAAKAAVMLNDQARSLLHFIQALSLRQGGLKQLALDLVNAFPERLGSKVMHSRGTKAGTIYSEEICDALCDEFDLPRQGRGDHLSDILEIPREERKPRPVAERKVERWLEVCRQHALAELPDYLIQLCINPKVRLWDRESDMAAIQEAHLENAGLLESHHDMRDGTLPYFKGIVPALLELQKLHSENAFGSVAKTTVANQVWENLDFCLARGKMVVIEGESRIGKSTAAEAWVNANLGRARFISLSGVTHKTGFFRAIARALGIPSSAAKTATDMQASVEAVLQRTRLVLVIDEAHYLWPQGERLYTRPELIDWVNTALFNHRIPVALVCTPQFNFRMKKVEVQTGWNSDQFKGRVGRYISLPKEPLESDLESVASMLFPGADEKTIDYVVGYADTSKRHLPAIVDLAAEADFIASRDGRKTIQFRDVKLALDGVVIPSDKAKATAMKSEPTRSRGRAKNPAENSLGNSIAEGVQDSGSEPAEATQSHRTISPLQTSAKRQTSTLETAGV